MQIGNRMLAIVVNLTLGVGHFHAQRNGGIFGDFHGRKISVETKAADSQVGRSVSTAALPVLRTAAGLGAG
jgi:hypothetical protein